MQEVIIIKYGELTTKKGNIKLFIDTLNKNVKTALKDIKYTEKHDTGRMFIFPFDNQEEIIKKLTNIFGIHEIMLGYQIKEKDIDKIGNSILELIKERDFETFKIETKRSDKSIPLTSIEISKKLGGIVLKNLANKKVEVNNPELTINVEIRNDYTYIYTNSIKGIGGYPVGVQGKGLLMLSGGIDSPVAGYLAIKRGIKLEAIYFESPPHTSLAAKNKVISLAKKISVYNNMSIKLHVINFTDIQESILKNIPHPYLITIMRRMMYRISAIISYNNNCKVLINGESIGQVASQTLTSMSVINEVVKIPVIRPVACFDKLEIIKLANKIDTYETSILPFEDCCTIFVPEHPVINPEHKLCEEYEKLIPYQDLIYEAIKKHEVIRIDNEEKAFSDLL